jgi:ribosomal protein L7/L12
VRGRSELAVECKALLARGLDNESLMDFLRAEGCSNIDSIVVLREVLNLSLGEAKALVHLSRTWGDVRERDDAFHEALIDAVNDKLGRARSAD